MTVSKVTLQGLRKRYRTIWQIDWPEGDEYLSELWLEAREATKAITPRVPPPETYHLVLVLMRESHEFIPELITHVR